MYRSNASTIYNTWMLPCYNEVLGRVILTIVCVVNDALFRNVCKKRDLLHCQGMFWVSPIQKLLQFLHNPF